MTKIYITGCAKTGTTLVRRLFNAFEGLKVCNHKELKPSDFANSSYNVGKRLDSLFADKLEWVWTEERPEEETELCLIKRQLKIFKDMITRHTNTNIAIVKILHSYRTMYLIIT